MTPRRVILTTLTVAICAGSFAPALASASSSNDTKRYCIALSSDPEKQEYAPICVWIPGSV